MKRSVSLVLLAVSLCAVKVGYAQEASLQGIEPADLNRAVQPCDNFYDFANGTWRAQHPIPASMDRWSRRWEAGEANKEQLR